MAGKSLERAADAPRPRTDHDAPIRLKLSVLVLLGVVAGALIGLAEARLDHRIWPLVGGILLATTFLMWVGKRWVCRPLELLADCALQACRSGRPASPDDLPLQQCDEIGRLARVIHELTLQAHREETEASHLRRTIDQRIEKSTRVATKELQRMAMRDALTNLGNRRFLDDQLEPLLASCQRSNTDLICILLDLDGFKQVNDTLGHATGDQLLMFLANLVRARVRKDDLAVRLGGDEFAILMPNCDLERARSFAESVDTLFRQHIRIVLPNDLPVGISIGVSSLRRDELTNAQDLMAAADANLYVAKNTGKGRTIGL